MPIADYCCVCGNVPCEAMLIRAVAVAWGNIWTSQFDEPSGACTSTVASYNTLTLTASGAGLPTFQQVWQFDSQANKWFNTSTSGSAAAFNAAVDALTPPPCADSSTAHIAGASITATDTLWTQTNDWYCADGTDVGLAYTVTGQLSNAGGPAFYTPPPWPASVTDWIAALAAAGITYGTCGLTNCSWVWTSTGYQTGSWSLTAGGSGPTAVGNIAGQLSATNSSPQCSNSALSAGVFLSPGGFDPNTDSNFGTPPIGSLEIWEGLILDTHTVCVANITLDGAGSATGCSSGNQNVDGGKAFGNPGDDKSTSVWSCAIACCLGFSDTPPCDGSGQCGGCCTTSS